MLDFVKEEMCNAITYVASKLKYARIIINAMNYYYYR